ncbi:hypothetical protein [Streptomyces sp. Z26]|uniref:hypothetical protein n=1 Tax=Streptomyces TaxID=1883 RepID=UPI000EF15914|nr:hypothetical protein [Streptomyces sp. Z26]RLL69844.1 hypothetical protein D7M15_26970 [Streptomyces sp. Z26]
MTVGFGRLGRVFLLAAAVALVATSAALALLDGTPRNVVALTFGVVALVALAQGVVWTVLQHRVFGGVAALRRVAASGHPAVATITAVGGTASAIGAEPVVRLDLEVLGRTVTRHVRVPFDRSDAVRAGRALPVRVDPEDPRTLVVEWDRLG